MNDGVPITEYANLKIGVYGGKFFPFHKGHMSFVEEALKYVDILFVVVQYDEEHEKALCVGTPFVPISPRLRERWITEIYKDNPQVRVFSQYEHRSENHMVDPLIAETYRELIEKCGHVDIIFSNTHEYDEYFAKWLPGVEHVVFLEDRSIYPISATKIREEGVYANWDFLPKPVQKHYLKRIAFCGWESAGKSFTAQAVSEKFKTKYLPEYGRTFYTEELGGYADIALPEDYINIAAGHLQQLYYAEGNKFISVDTDMIYTQFYHILENGYKNEALDAMIRANSERISTYIFLEPRNAFADDGSRFRIDDIERQRISDQLKALYLGYGRELIVIDEIDNKKRLEAVFDVVNTLVSV